MAGSVLHIDTDLLKQAALAAKRANDNITQAMTLINQVTEHNDWQCSRRDQINEYARNNRAYIGKLQADAESFYNAVQTVSDRFVEREQQAANRSNSIDEKIGDIMSVSRPSSGIHDFGDNFYYAASPDTVSGSVNITDFGNVASGLTGGGKDV